MSNRKPMAAIAQMSHCTGPRRMGAGTAGEEDIGIGQPITMVREDSSPSGAERARLRAKSRSGWWRMTYNAVDDLDEGIQLAGDFVHGDGQRVHPACKSIHGDSQCCEFLVRPLLCFGEQDLGGEE